MSATLERRTMGGKCMFVTVGTTQFDELIDRVSEDSFLDWIVAQNYGSLIIQYGRGSKPSISPARLHNQKLDIELYDFKPSLEADMKAADTIVSHAGAGTIMEALKLQKCLAAVINPTLMNNHQTELAHALSLRNHILVVDDPRDLEQDATRQKLQDFVPIPRQDGDDQAFPRLLDSFMGFHSKSQ